MPNVAERNPLAGEGHPQREASLCAGGLLSAHLRAGDLAEAPVEAALAGFQFEAAVVDVADLLACFRAQGLHPGQIGRPPLSGGCETVQPKDSSAGSRPFGVARSNSTRGKTSATLGTPREQLADGEIAPWRVGGQQVRQRNMCRPCVGQVDEDAVEVVQFVRLHSHHAVQPRPGPRRSRRVQALDPPARQGWADRAGCGSRRCRSGDRPAAGCRVPAPRCPGSDSHGRRAAIAPVRAHR